MSKVEYIGDTGDRPWISIFATVSGASQGFTTLQIREKVAGALIIVTWPILINHEGKCFKPDECISRFGIIILRNLEGISHHSFHRPEAAETEVKLFRIRLVLTLYQPNPLLT